MRCNLCKQDKPETEFALNKSTSRGRQYRCKPCNRISSKDWYATNKDRVSEANNARARAWRKVHRAEAVAVVNELKSEPCMDCHYRFHPWQMQFDHRVPADKEHNVAQMVQKGMALTAILEEIKKCDLVCANCHADRTYKRNHDGDDLNG